MDLACRVWDVFCRDGEEFLFRTALGLLRLYQDVLTCMDFIHMAQFLTRLPDLIPAEQLFQHIAAVHMASRNRKWAQVRPGIVAILVSGSISNVSHIFITAPPPLSPLSVCALRSCWLYRKIWSEEVPYLSAELRSEENHDTLTLEE